MKISEEDYELLVELVNTMDSDDEFSPIVYELKKIITRIK